MSRAKPAPLCDAESDQPIAAPFEALTEVVLGGLGFDWNEPTNEGIMYISREGGGLATHRTTADVLYDASFSENDDVIGAVDDNRPQADPQSRRSQLSGFRAA